MYTIVWSQARVAKLKIGDGKCHRCQDKEDYVYILMQCPKTHAYVAKLVQCKNLWSGIALSHKHLLLGESIECSLEYWTVLSCEMLWKI